MKTRETVRTATGRIVTMRDVRQLSESLAVYLSSPADRFAINYALNQYGKALAKRITALILDGHEVSPSSNGNTDGFLVDGEYRSCRDILGRDWWR